ncbi:TOMM precursor leader peptide-binding protein [Tumebacillus permanentifrigoris]|uniref:Ribosomal protein S12 methylthiotransferase accessory factor n=1 Tax=Tumebacillus permanentifrigoris TaxID=378543 RepID=A0A316DPG7_9BACL|nr:TOMM precursor leader peptide-binding protein [Tumebacillus permanentifrigoris]PWK04968.1 ribosomal protein S12 methylthiotransferase accessory factor [Tumebacillus permanentifrigoris]
MIQMPVLKPIVQVDVLRDDAVLVITETGSTLWEGSAYVRLLPFLQKGISTVDLVAQMRGAMSAAEVYYILLEWERAGVLMEATSTVPEPLVGWLSSLVPDVPAAYQLLQKTTVSLTSFGPVDATRLAQELLMPVAPDQTGDFEIVLTDDYLRAELQAVNERALASGRPWMLAKPIGNVLWIGPVFRPGVSGCWVCLAQRLRGDRRIAGVTTLDRQTGYELVAQEAMKAVVLGERHALNGALVTLDLQQLQSETHTVVRRPQCPVCGEQTSAAPLVLKSQPVAVGEYRTVSAQETLQKFGHHVSAITGVVKRLERVQDRGGLVHNYVAGVNHAGGAGLRSSSGGKGTDDLQAQAGALCEALERYSGRFQGEEERISASFLELGERALHPNRLMLFSDDQYAQRAERNARNTLPGRQIPLLFDEADVLDWTPVWSLTEQKFKYVPTASCFFGYPDTRYCHADSNGCAAGNSREEAILQGFFELVERDSVAMWWYNRVARGAVDWASFHLPYVARLQEHYHTLGREFWVLDITHDFGIPSFVAVSRAVGGATEDLLCGFGAHLDPQIALLRALTEMNQFLPALADRERQDAVTRQWWRTATLENQPYLAPDGGIPVKRASDFQTLHVTDLRETVHHCQAIVEGKGLELLVLDLTRPDVGLPVVKVIVPGLRHFWNRFARGRLYDVPVELGWLSSARTETELNSIPLFF